MAGTRVPLIVAGAGIKGRRVVNELVDFTDLLPTLADAIGAGLPAGIPLDGRNFWPQLIGARGNPCEAIYNYYFPRPYAKELSTPNTYPEIRYAFDHRYKLYSDGRLFDLVADPEEKRPLSGLDAVRRKLQAVIDRMPPQGRRKCTPANKKRLSPGLTFISSYMLSKNIERNNFLIPTGSATSAFRPSPSLICGCTS